MRNEWKTIFWFMSIILGIYILGVGAGYSFMETYKSESKTSIHFNSKQICYDCQKIINGDTIKYRNRKGEIVLWYLNK